MEALEITSNEQDFKVIQEEEGGIFSSLDWLNLFGDKLLIIGFKEGGQLIGYSVLYKTSLKGIKTLSTAPFTPHISFAVRYPSEKTSSRNKRLKDAMRALVEYLDERKEMVRLFSLPPRIKDAQVFQWANYRLTSRFTYHIDLSKEIDEILFCADTKTKSLIKKTKDFTFVGRERGAEIISCIKGTLKRSGAIQNEEILNSIFNDFSNEKNSFIIGIEEYGEITAGAFFLIGKKTMFYLFGGGSKDQKDPAASTALIWKGILMAKELGLSTFDFEGSMVPEIERFFRGFGGEIIPSFTISRAPLALEPILRRKFRYYF